MRVGFAHFSGANACVGGGKCQPPPVAARKFVRILGGRPLRIKKPQFFDAFFSWDNLSARFIYSICEEVGGWTVVEITPDHIVVRHDTTEAEMSLDYTTPAPPVQAAKTPAPNDPKPSATKQIGAEPQDTEAQGIIPGQPPEVLPPPDDEEQQSLN